MAKAELIEQVLRATWSLEEAAHLVNAVNQATDPVELDGRRRGDRFYRGEFLHHRWNTDSLNGMARLARQAFTRLPALMQCHFPQCGWAVAPMFATVFRR